MISKITTTIICIGLILLLFCVVTTILISYTSYEFRDGDFWEFFKVSSIPISIFVTSIGFIFKIRALHVSQQIIAVLASLGLSFFVFICLLMMTALDLCTASYTPLFYLKTNKTVQIEKSYFGCGAVDSTPATESFVKTETTLFGLMHVSKVDTNQIDQSKWIRIIK